MKFLKEQLSRNNAITVFKQPKQTIRETLQILHRLLPDGNFSRSQLSDGLHLLSKDVEWRRRNNKADQFLKLHFSKEPASQVRDDNLRVAR